MSAFGPYVLEDSPEGRSLVVTGPWSVEAANALGRGEADGLVLNYARGFSGRCLEFLDGGLGVRRLDVLDRQITDLAPIERLADSLEDLSVQAAGDAELDLGALPRLRSVAGEWALIGNTLGAVDELQSVITWQFDEADLHAFRDHVGLRRLTIKEAPYLESLSGVACPSWRPSASFLLVGFATLAMSPASRRRFADSSCRTVRRSARSTTSSRWSACGSSVSANAETSPRSLRSNRSRSPRRSTPGGRDESSTVISRRWSGCRS